MDSFTLDPLELDDGNFSFLINYTVDGVYSSPKDVSMFCILYFVVCAVGLVGNAFVIYVVLRYRKMRTVANIYVFSLALGDLLYMFCLLFFATEIAFSYWPLGTFMCKLFWALTNVVTFSSIYFLTIMSINDCVMVYFPVFSSNRLGPKVATVISICVWVLFILLGIPIFIYAELDDFLVCRILWPEPTTIWSVIFISCRFAMSFALPLALNCVCLILTAVRVKGSEQPGGVCKESMIMLLVLSLVFVLFWIPMHVLEMMSVTGVIWGLSEEVYYFVCLIPYLKCCVYPILYGVLSHSFTEAYKKVLCCKNVKTVKNPEEGSENK
ncbi:somatostatin receptor type 5-like [Ascaphus truei]|uniref:somatostatin receptor type 5-like n=1 Tax=Ascaphus truei TaxID=8439 RepID=UPI003F59FA29